MSSGGIKFRLLHKIRPKSSWTTQNLLAKILDCALVRPSHSSKTAQLIVLVWSKGQSFWAEGTSRVGSSRTLGGITISVVRFLLSLFHPYFYSFRQCRTIKTKIETSPPLPYSIILLCLLLLKEFRAVNTYLYLWYP